eukprot:CAMPEP_0198284258 /NCGR_PEP_ID=MMETSP1449-20131203/3745_1 /TAXON_ID=420275 /ORGANISM="Attheya septentrionalis, Strain CCMP2084" /LENGTH=40 /DNA_ID= /DNA_START= /DNA_END= /DNA_ORIENTATION=
MTGTAEDQREDHRASLPSAEESSEEDEEPSAKLISPFWDE